MKIVKYNRGNTGYTIGSAASINSQKPSESTTTNTAPTSVVDCNLWGNKCDGVSDIEDTIFVNGSLYAMPNMFEDEDEEEEEEKADGEEEEFEEKVFEPYEDDEGGNIYAQNLIRGNEVFGKTIFLDYPERAEDIDEKTRDYESKKMDLLEVLKMLVPVGSIMMHNGSVSSSKLLEYGWAVCDGSNGTPNLIDKFIRAGSSAGATGGKKEVTLTIDNMPSHNHSATSTANSSASSSGSVNCAYSSSSVSIAEGEGSNVSAVGSVTTGNRTVSVSTTVNTSVSTSIGNTGGGKAFEIIPEYYTLIFIMRIR